MLLARCHINILHYCKYSLHSFTKPLKEEGWLHYYSMWGKSNMYTGSCRRTKCRRFTGDIWVPRVTPCESASFYDQWESTWKHSFLPKLEKFCLLTLEISVGKRWRHVLLCISQGWATSQRNLLTVVGLWGYCQSNLIKPLPHSPDEAG